jgi:hypothetical protein
MSDKELSSKEEDLRKSLNFAYSFGYRQALETLTHYLREGLPIYRAIEESRVVLIKVEFDMTKNE